MKLPLQCFAWSALAVLVILLECAVINYQLTVQLPWYQFAVVQATMLWCYIGLYTTVYQLTSI